jgi:hypothetical protein
MLLLKFLLAGSVAMSILISYITMKEGAKEGRIHMLLNDGEDPEQAP